MSLVTEKQKLRIFTPGIDDLREIRILAKKSGLFIEDVDEDEFLELFRWLYFSDCQDIERLQLGLVDGAGKIVGHYGGVPFIFRLNDKKVQAVLASNLVINPNNRAGSTFYDLQREFIRGYRELGYEFAFGLITRQGVLDVHMRMGWKKIGDMPVYVRPVDCVNILSKFISSKTLKLALYLPGTFINLILKIINRSHNNFLEIQRIFSFDDGFNNFLKEWNSLNEIASIRTIEVLNWRYCERVERGYQIYRAKSADQIIGYAVFRQMKMKEYQVLALVDLVADKNDESVVDALLKQAINVASSMGVDMVATALLPHDPILNRFFKNAFIKSPEKFILVAHFPKKNAVNFKDLEKWRINWFDHDYV